MKIILTVLFALLAFVTVACAGNVKEPPDETYKKVSDLVALPEFLPGMGTLYVQPDTLPVGPFLAYDRDGKLVSTIYMVPMEDMEQQKGFVGLAVGDDRVKKVDMTFNPGHAGVPVPHYHVTLWHVDPATANLK